MEIFKEFSFEAAHRLPKSLKDANVGDFTATRSGFEFRISKLEHDNRRLNWRLARWRASIDIRRPHQEDC